MSSFLIQYGNREGYGPPSPATQFMMSPQASFAYNYGYGFSPRRPSSHRKPSSKPTAVAEEGSSKTDDTEVDKSKPVPATPPPKAHSRGSPATVETTAESESLADAA